MKVNLDQQINNNGITCAQTSQLAYLARSIVDSLKWKRYKKILKTIKEEWSKIDPKEDKVPPVCLLDTIEKAFKDNKDVNKIVEMFRDSKDPFKWWFGQCLFNELIVRKNKK